MDLRVDPAGRDQELYVILLQTMLRNSAFFIYSYCMIKFLFLESSSYIFKIQTRQFITWGQHSQTYPSIIFI